MPIGAQHDGQCTLQKCIEAFWAMSRLPQTESIGIILYTRRRQSAKRPRCILFQRVHVQLLATLEVYGQVPAPTTFASSTSPTLLLPASAARLEVLVRIGITSVTLGPLLALRLQVLLFRFARGHQT